MPDHLTLDLNVYVLMESFFWFDIINLGVHCINLGVKCHIFQVKLYFFSSKIFFVLANSVECRWQACNYFSVKRTEIYSERPNEARGKHFSMHKTTARSHHILDDYHFMA